MKIYLEDISYGYTHGSFHSGLLPGGHWVTIEGVGAHCIIHTALKRIRMSEFSPSVCEDKRHGIAEQVGANGLFHPVEDSFDASGFFGIQ